MISTLLSSKSQVSTACIYSMPLFPQVSKIELWSYMFHIVDMVLRNLLGRDCFTGAAVGFGHHGPALPRTPFLCHAFTLPPSCWLHHSSAFSKPFQFINPTENNSLFSVARFTVPRDGKKNWNKLQSFKHNTHSSISSYQKFKPSFIDLQRTTHCPTQF